MKELIDINDEIYRHAKDGSEDSNDEWNAMRAIANGTPIPDNATNGEVIMAMFPNVNVYEHNGGATYSVNNEYNFNATWWNALYQKGGKE